MFKFKTTDIIRAAKNNDYNLVQNLLQNTNVDFKDKNGKTALFYAVLEHNIDLCTLLIENGANIYIRDDRNLMPIHYAMLIKNNDIIDLFYENNFKYSIDILKNDISDLDLEDNRLFLKLMKKLF